MANVIMLTTTSMHEAAEHAAKDVSPHGPGSGTGPPTSPPAGRPPYAFTYLTGWCRC